MRTTLNLDENLYREAAMSTGISEKTKLIHLGFEALIKAAARQRLAKLHGKIKSARHIPRRRIS